MEALKIIQERDQLAAQAVKSFNVSVPAIQKDIYKAILRFIRELDTDNDGNIKATSKNLKAISLFVNRDIRKILNKSDYKDNVTTFVKSFKELSRLTDKYFTTIAQ